MELDVNIFGENTSNLTSSEYLRLFVNTYTLHFYLIVKNNKAQGYLSNQSQAAAFHVFEISIVVG